MPIYEFACQKCGKLVEEMLKVDQRGPTKCAHCGARMKRVISRTSFHLKGGGWYKDLYSSTKETPKGDDAPTAKSPDEKPAAPASTEAKPDKPDNKPAAAPAPGKTKKAEPSKKADAKKSVA